MLGGLVDGAIPLDDEGIPVVKDTLFVLSSKVCLNYLNYQYYRTNIKTRVDTKYRALDEYSYFFLLTFPVHG